MKNMKEMENEKLSLNELEQVNGGNLLDDVKDALKKLNPFKNEPTIPNPLNPETPDPIVPDPIARGL